MPGTGKGLTRAVVVAVLLILAAVALRGYLPGVDQKPRDPPADGPASTIAVVVMLGVSLLIIVLAILTRPANTAAAAAAGEPPRDWSGERGWLTWRLLLVAAGVVIVWLLTVLLLMRLGAGLDVQDAPPPESAPEAGATDPAAGRPPPPDTGNSVFGYLAAASVLLLLLSMTATVVSRRRRAPQASSDAADGPSPERARHDPLTRAAQQGLAAIGDPNREPREAIIACYAAMEHELEKAPGAMPQDSDTPSEVLARAVEHRAVPAHSATHLVELFEEARFSPHVMTERHRDAAVHALRVVLGELQGAT